MSRPNIVVFLSDDHAEWALGCSGNSEIRTPTLDHLARTGVRMRNAFTPSPVCSPARASFWTGLFPSQHGVHDFLALQDPEVAATPWLAGERLLGEQLQAGGYETAMVGKWHLGRTDETASGFDHWAPNDYLTATPGRQVVTDDAVRFLRERDTERPFFLYVGHFATHSPWQDRPERLVDQYRTATFGDIPDDPVYPYGRMAGEALFTTRNQPRAALAQYYAAVSEIDEGVGRVLDELEMQGLTDDTLVVYTSDHGLMTGHHGLWGKGNATVPYNMLDESIRVPMILRQPGVLLGDQVRDEFVNHCDLFELLLDHAGADVRDRRHEYPGRSFRELCRGGYVPDWPDEVFAEYGDTRMVRTRTEKLVWQPGAGRTLLFDLVADPRESVDVAGDRAASVAELTKRLDDWFARYDERGTSGLRVADLPRHNKREAWRDHGRHDIVAHPPWLAR
ncbi:arylsulfatase A-like enzyme [Kribbella aluminosa]|uniref:Arylsulfatase A-like enzyme n=1 Tax=Kribbella aluminosa TaxID=416017 RepID=A0ABS4UJ05_9ACTN|nr:sulfatase-like hydrolase/transferase [Kribbella aluminosa]MBP2351589.1 arylsulfatase A-like enzyme [Kribbella aluminosa]